MAVRRVRDVHDVFNVSVQFTPVLYLHHRVMITGSTVSLTVVDTPICSWQLVSDPEVYVHGLIVADLVVTFPPGETKNIVVNVILPKNGVVSVLLNSSLSQYFVGKSIQLLQPVELSRSDGRQDSSFVLVYFLI